MNHLAIAYTQFLEDSNAESFLSVIESHGGYDEDTGLDYPFVHRINEIYLDGTVYRIIRTYDVETRDSKLFVYPTDIAEKHAGTPGVPHELKGNDLHQWILDESDKPLDVDNEKTNWEHYLAMDR